MKFRKKPVVIEAVQTESNCLCADRRARTAGFEALNIQNVTLMEQIIELERHRAEDAKAINEVAGGRYMDEDFVLNDDYWYPRWQIKHAAAIKRAREGEGK